MFVKLPPGCGRINDSNETSNLVCIGLGRQRGTGLIFGVSASSGPVLIEDGMVVLHADGHFSEAEGERCEKYAMDVNQRVPVKFLGKLRVY